MRLSIRLIFVSILIATIFAGVYAINMLFTQTVPQATVKPPGGSPTAVSNCSTLTMSPDTITLSISSPTLGVMNLTCSGGPAFAVTTAGIFTATIGGNCGSDCGPHNIPLEYYPLNYIAYSDWQSRGCGTRASPSGEEVPTSGNFVSLAKGDYVYCLAYFLAQYTTSSHASIPSFTITWNAP